VMTKVSSRPRRSMPSVTVVSSVLGRQLPKSHDSSGSGTCEATVSMVASTAALLNRRSPFAGRRVGIPMFTVLSRAPTQSASLPRGFQFVDDERLGARHSAGAAQCQAGLASLGFLGKKAACQRDTAAVGEGFD